MPRVFDDEEEKPSDVWSFEAVAPEKDHGLPNEPATSTFASERHPHILEDVDGELEMEDVSPSCESEVSSGCCVRIDNVHTYHSQFEQRQSLPFVPPLPKDILPSRPLPCSPLPTAPLPPQQSAMCLPFDDAVYSWCFQGTQVC